MNKAIDVPLPQRSASRFSRYPKMLHLLCNVRVTFRAFELQLHLLGIGFIPVNQNVGFDVLLVRAPDVLGFVAQSAQGRLGPRMIFRRCLMI